MTELNRSKIEKFDKLLEEYQSLLYYRNSLAGTVLNNVEALCVEQTTCFEDSEVDKKLNPESIRSIMKEIENTDIIISFISSIVFGESVIKQSTQFDATNHEPDESNLNISHNRLIA